jgi:PPOX class probable F420-dependent enzyme
MTPAQVRSFLRLGTRTGDDAVFTTGAESVKRRAGRRDPRVALCLDDEHPPYAFVTVTGEASLSSDLDELLHFATQIGGRYMGADQARSSAGGTRVPGGLLVRVTRPTVVAETDVAA